MLLIALFLLLCSFKFVFIAYTRALATFIPLNANVGCTGNDELLTGQPIDTNNVPSTEAVSTYATCIYLYLSRRESPITYKYEWES
jgi:hypothetical protein